MPLPINRQQAHRAARWMKTDFGEKITAALAGTPFTLDHLCAMACQETAYVWLGFLDNLSTDEILARCVLDASGDYPGTSRSVFPRNTAEFRDRYGDGFTQLLIDEANETRALRGYGPKGWVYKGYGIFQYDLQYVEEDEDFFRQKRWYSFDACLEKAVGELREKYAAKGDVWLAIRAYNGRGPKAEAYEQNVRQYTEWCAEVSV